MLPRKFEKIPKSPCNILYFPLTGVLKKAVETSTIRVKKNQFIEDKMTTASNKMIQAIEYVVKPLSVGTNLALLHLIWAMVSGAFLSSRGAVHTALNLSGRSDSETRRSGAALRKGQWQIRELIERWREWVMREGKWKVRKYEGWRAVSADVVVFPRLKLKGWKAKLYRGTFGKAIKAVGLGLVVDIGHYEGSRVPLLRKIVRCKNIEKSGQQLQKELLHQTAKILRKNEVFVHDAGVSTKEVQAAGIKHFVLRCAKNCVARRNYFPKDGHGNRKYGAYIRPLARTRKGKEVQSTNDPDTKTTFEHQGRTIKAWCWRQVVGGQDKVADNAQPYNLWVFLTPHFQPRSSWRQMLRRKLQRYSSYIVTAGLSSSYRWQPSR